MKKALPLLLMLSLIFTTACSKSQKIDVESIPYEIQWTVTENFGYSIEAEPEDESIITVSVNPCDVPPLPDGESVSHTMTLKGLKEGTTILHISYVYPSQDADNYVRHESYQVVVSEYNNTLMIESVTFVN